MSALLAALAAGLAVLLAGRPRPRLPDPVPVVVTTRDGPRPWRRPLLALLAGFGAALFLGGPLAPVVGVAAAGGCWWWLGTVEPTGVRREREEVRRDLPAVVHLLGAGLRSGAAPGEAVRLACTALPGAAADRLEGVGQRLALGADPGSVWSALTADEALAPLGRCLARAHETGAPVVESVDRLGRELEAEHRLLAESRARAVGVKAALPLGLCLLPSFLLLGIVPLAVGLLSGIAP